jgi:hypothetical protein
MWDHSSLSMSLSVVVYRAWSRYKSGFLFLVRSFKFIRFFLSPSRLDLASQFLGLTIDKLRDSGAVIFSSCPVRIHPFSRVMLNYFTHYLRVINPAVTYKKFMSWSHDACVSRLSNMIITLKISFFSAFDLTQKSPLESRRELREWLDQMTCSQCRREADGRFLRRGWFSVGYFRRLSLSLSFSVNPLSRLGSFLRALFLLRWYLESTLYTSADAAYRPCAVTLCIQRLRAAADGRCWVQSRGCRANGFAVARYGSMYPIKYYVL